MPSIIYSLKGLKGSSQESFEINVQLNITFSPFAYSISSNYLKQSISKPYNSYLLDLEIKDICKQISKRVLEEIQQAVSESS